MWFTFTACSRISPWMLGNPGAHCGEQEGNGVKGRTLEVLEVKSEARYSGDNCQHWTRRRNKSSCWNQLLMGAWVREVLCHFNLWWGHHINTINTMQDSACGSQVSDRWRAIKMQFFCLKLQLWGMCWSEGVWVIWIFGSGRNLAGAEDNGVGTYKNLVPLTCEFLLGSPTLSDDFSLMLGSFITSLRKQHREMMWHAQGHAWRLG